MCHICCRMIVVIIPGELSASVERNKRKVTTARSLPLCCSLVSVKKKLKKDKFVYLRNVEEEFRSRDQMTTSHNTRQRFAPSRAHSRTDGPEVTVIYTGRNLKPNTFRLVLKDNSEYRTR